METYDLVILGSGSTAFAAAIRAAELGKNVVMTESWVLGGTCVNRGCLPSKNLIEAARLYWEANHPRYPGLASHGMDLDFAALVRQKDDVVHDYRDKKYQSIIRDADRIKVVSGAASFTQTGTVRVSGTELVGQHYLIATGSRPAVPQIEGLADVPYLTSDLLTADESLELLELPRSLIIIGGGYIALELGQMFHRFGAAVTILERGIRVLPNYEPEVSLELMRILRDEGIHLVTGATVERVAQEDDVATVRGKVEGMEVPFRGERLLVATGRTPNTDRLQLDAIGVATDLRGFVSVDEYLQTSVHNVWAAGDVVGGHAESQMATPVGAHDGVIATRNAIGGERVAVDHAVVPRTIFTDPQVAVVGLTDEEANARGYRCSCRTIPMRLVPRAGAVRDTRGLIKMVLDAETRQVLGVSILGRDAGEVIHEAAMAIRCKATVYDFIDMVHVYPTMAEALKIAAVSFFKDVEKLSCCAE
ncbi:MAG: mercury(II) reductase [bacterium]